MKYPEFINKGSCIGIVAPSAGISSQEKLLLLNNAVKKLSQKGYDIKLSNSVKCNSFFVSATPEVRAKEFMDMWFDKNIDAIISVAGGELMQEILPFIDFDLIKNSKPKFFQGMSDNTNLTLTLTTICDIACIYGDNLLHFGQSKWHRVLKNQFEFLNGKNKAVKSEPKIQIEKNNEIGHELDSYNCTEKSNWKILSGEKKVNFTGRLVGGCMDIIQNIIGTRFDNIKNYIEKYKTEGIIWFIESCDLNIMDQCRFFWKLKELGYLKYCKGIIIGRPLNKTIMCDFDYLTANYKNLKDLNIPVIIDCDFGHVHPCFHIVSGAIGNVSCKNGKGLISYTLI